LLKDGAFINKQEFIQLLVIKEDSTDNYFVLCYLWNTLQTFVEGKRLMINPVQLNEFISKVNKIEGNSILSSWEGFSVYSEKHPLVPENYQGLFLNNIYDSLPLILRKNLTRDVDYNNMILSGIPDILVYEKENPMHFAKVPEIIELKYEPRFIDHSITVYSRNK
jgi:hypothetical protein